MTTAILEGFLCPVCKKDLVDVARLHSHFQEAHQNGSDDRDLVDNLKGLFGKAKERIFDTLPAPRTSEFSSQNPFDFEENIEDQEPQQLGQLISHTDDFKKYRKNLSVADRSGIETTKLLIRLDKLVNSAPSDPSQRKAFERDTVPWTVDSETPFCRFCSSRFGLTKRKHHCRLCGKIMCNGCSEFLTFIYARKLVNPDFAMSYKEEAEKLKQAASPVQKSKQQNATEKVEKLFGALSTKLKRDGSEHSIGSLLNQEGEDHLRICRDCKTLLDRFDQQVEQRTQPPIVQQMYERLKQLMDDLDKISVTFFNMAQSISNGETFYNLQTAQELRMKALRLCEQIDATSKKIPGLNPVLPSTADLNAQDSNQPPVTVRQLLVQRNIRSYAVAFLQGVVPRIPQLPTEEEFTKLQKLNKQRLEAQIEAERRAASSLPLFKRDQAVISPVLGQSGGGSPAVRKAQSQQGSWNRSAPEDSGWTPDLPANRQFARNPFDDDDAEPESVLQEQIRLIRQYIRQAAEAGRIDEVKTLEHNLKELIKEQQASANTVNG